MRLGAEREKTRGSPTTRDRGLQWSNPRAVGIYPVARIGNAGTREPRQACQRPDRGVSGCAAGAVGRVRGDRRWHTDFPVRLCYIQLPAPVWRAAART